MNDTFEEKMLQDFGYIVIARKVHATEYKNGNNILYTIPSQQINVVISPEDIGSAEKYICKKYHNSNLSAFPKEKHNGKKEIHYGYKIVFDNLNSMKQFLEEYVKSCS